VIQPAGVILAAGRASRMGRPKQLLPYGSTSVLGSVIAAADTSRLERVVVVIGAYVEDVSADAALTRVEVVVNPDPDRGNMSSLLIAAEQVGDRPILLMMGDMPGLPAEVIDAHLDAWARDPASMRVTAYLDRRGHPLLLPSALVADLPNLEGLRPLWALTADPSTAILAVDGNMPVDVDTPEDYRAALESRRREQDGG